MKHYIKTKGPVPEAVPITAGKVYAVDQPPKGLCRVLINDNGDWQAICIPHCSQPSCIEWTFCDQHGTPVPAPWESKKKECKCSLRTALVGDGCSVCNPELAAEYALERAQEDAATYRAHAERLAEKAGAVAQLAEGPDESTNDAFERLAALFQRETGYVSPGKDCLINDYGLRASVWAEWYQAKWQDLHAALSAYNQAKGEQQWC